MERILSLFLPEPMALRLAWILGVLLVASPAVACDHFTRAYNTAATVDFCLWATDGTALINAATFEAADVKIMQDEGAEANSTNSPSDEGQCFSLVVAAAELDVARTTIIIHDDDAAWLDKCIVIDTFGNASAQFPTADVNVVTFTDGAIAAADFAAGAIDASAIAAGAIGASELAADAIGESELAANSITSSEVADDSIDAGAIAASAITSSEVAADAIGASEIAADAIASSELAATAADEISTDLLATSTSELAACPAATATVETMLQYLYTLGRNKFTSTSSAGVLFKDDAASTLCTFSTSDNGTTFTNGEGS